MLYFVLLVAAAVGALATFAPRRHPLVAHRGLAQLKRVTGLVAENGRALVAQPKTAATYEREIWTQLAHYIDTSLKTGVVAPDEIVVVAGRDAYRALRRSQHVIKASLDQRLAALELSAVILTLKADDDLQPGHLHVDPSYTADDDTVMADRNARPRPPQTPGPEPTVTAVTPDGRTVTRLLSTERPLSIGRSAGNDIVLEDLTVSRRACTLLLRDGRVLLEVHPKARSIVRIDGTITPVGQTGAISWAGATTVRIGDVTITITPTMDLENAATQVAS